MDLAITERGLKELSALKQLRTLYLNGTSVTGVPELKPCQQLQTLNLHGTRVGENGLREIGHLTGLLELSLGFTGITDAELKYLSGLGRLEVLELDRTHVTDEGMKDLQQLTNLRILDLSDTGLTDAGLKELKVLKHLEQLDIDKTRVTRDGISELRRALPRLQVVWHPSWDDELMRGFHPWQLLNIAWSARLGWPLAGGMLVLLAYGVLAELRKRTRVILRRQRSLMAALCGRERGWCEFPPSQAFH